MPLKVSEFSNIFNISDTELSGVEICLPAVRLQLRDGALGCYRPYLAFNKTVASSKSRLIASCSC